MDVRESSLGTLPCLVAGSGPPLVLLAGLMPEAGVSAGSLRRTLGSSMRPWVRDRQVFCVNRRPGLQRGMTMAALGAEHACRAPRDRARRAGRCAGSGQIRRAASLSSSVPSTPTRCVGPCLSAQGARLGLYAKLVQRQIAARVRAGATQRQTAAADGRRAGPASASIAGRHARQDGYSRRAILRERLAVNMATTNRGPKTRLGLARPPADGASTDAIGGRRT